MRISDWSSDVCSSDLAPWPPAPRTADLVHQENFVSEKVIHATDADFDSTVLQSSEPVLVDFWAEWCGPCKMIAPALDELAEAYDGKVRIAKVNVDQNRGTAMKYHVQIGRAHV